MAVMMIQPSLLCERDLERLDMAGFYTEKRSSREPSFAYKIPHRARRHHCPDQDDKFLEAALAGGADCIVSGGADLLEMTISNLENLSQTCAFAGCDECRQSHSRTGGQS